MEIISRTRKKLQALSVQALGERLVKLSAGQLEKIKLPEELRNAVMTAKTIRKHGALNRQMQYIGVLMRKTDVTRIQEALQSLESLSRRQTEWFRQVERWRDELIGGNDAVIEDVLRAAPSAGRERLTELVAKAREELTKINPSPTPSRVLFRHLHKAAQEQHQVSVEPDRITDGDDAP